MLYKIGSVLIATTKSKTKSTYPLNPRLLLIGDAVFAAEFSPDIVKSEMIGAKKAVLVCIHKQKNIL